MLSTIAIALGIGFTVIALATVGAGWLFLHLAARDETYAE